MLLRTAKSCGPDAPTLASSLRSRIGPTGLRQDISAGDGGKRARSPGRARRKPLKPLRAGMPGDSGVLVYSCAFYQYQVHTRPRVQRASGVPHALFWARASSTPRAHRVARAKSYADSSSLRAAKQSTFLSVAAAMDCFAEPVIGRAFARRSAMPGTSIFRILYNRQSGLYLSRLSTGSDGSQKGWVS
jgi:hypothetical protein